MAKLARMARHRLQLPILWTSRATGPPLIPKMETRRDVFDATTLALRGHVGPDGPHEGVVFWLGRIVMPNTYVLSMLVPRSEHREGFVRVPAVVVGDAGRAARAMGLAFVCQVHSHPGRDTRHSDGDDQMVPLPSEGMFSVVVGRFGDGGLTPEEGAASISSRTALGSDQPSRARHGRGPDPVGAMSDRARFYAERDRRTIDRADVQPGLLGLGSGLRRPGRGSGDLGPAVAPRDRREHQGARATGCAGTRLSWTGRRSCL